MTTMQNELTAVSNVLGRKLQCGTDLKGAVQEAIKGINVALAALPPGHGLEPARVKLQAVRDGLKSSVENFERNGR